MSTVKTYLLQCVAFLSILVVLVYVTGFGLKKFALTYDPGESKLIEVTELKDKNYDVLFMGNSLTVQAVIPGVVDSILGTNSYNMAMNGANFLSMELLLHNYLQKNPKPKYIVYGLFVNHEKKEQNIRPSILAEVSEKTHIYYHNYLKKHDIERNYSIELYNRLPLFRYRNSLKFVAYALKHKKPFENSKGFTKKTKKYKGLGRYPKHQANIDVEQLNAFYNYCEKQGIELIFFEPPNSTVYNNSVTNREETLQLLLSDKTHVTDMLFLNDDSDYLDQKKDFANLNHLNYDGAQKFSKKLASALRGKINL